MNQCQYPFIPKSTKPLERGQFWSIPLPDGSFGAGCVVGLHLRNGKTSSRAFIAGVVAWHGDSPPTADALGGKKIFQYAFAHIKTIIESGGQIIGKANIMLDDLPETAEALSISSWGYSVPTLLAKKYTTEVLRR